MISIWVILSILLIHWFADFIVQTDFEARNKSTNHLALLSHVVSYTGIWIIPALVWSFSNNGSPVIMWFVPITFICHFITDFFTSRLNTKLYKNNKIHEFFISVGFDQFLHYLQLFITYWLLTK